MTRLLLSAALLLSSAQIAAAQACTAPPIPACLATAAPFSGEDEMRDCQGSLSLYRDQVTDFAGCLRAQAEGVQADANSLAARFRCRTGQQDACVN